MMPVSRRVQATHLRLSWRWVTCFFLMLSWAPALCGVGACDESRDLFLADATVSSSDERQCISRLRLNPDCDRIERLRATRREAAELRPSVAVARSKRAMQRPFVSGFDDAEYATGGTHLRRRVIEVDPEGQYVARPSQVDTHAITVTFAGLVFGSEYGGVLSIIALFALWCFLWRRVRRAPTIGAQLEYAVWSADGLKSGAGGNLPAFLPVPNVCSVRLPNEQPAIEVTAYPTRVEVLAVEGTKVFGETVVAGGAIEVFYEGPLLGGVVYRLVDELGSARYVCVRRRGEDKNAA